MRTVSMSIRSHWLTLQIITILTYTEITSLGAVAGATQIDAKAQIEQGYTEQSNVNVISEMVSMINITRAYEAGQKMIQTQDSLLQKSANEIGKV